MSVVVRNATEADLPAIVDIYNEVIANSTAIWIDDPLTLDDRRAWLAMRRQQNYPVLVAERDGALVGFASFGEFRPQNGFRFTVEHSVHVKAGVRGGGVGLALMNALVSKARDLGKHIIVGAVDASNDASMRFHLKLGFVETGRMPQVGYKFGRWLDMVLLQKTL